MRVKLINNSINIIDVTQMSFDITIVFSVCVCACVRVLSLFTLESLVLFLLLYWSSATYERK
jgi:hypothetical protein